MPKHRILKSVTLALITLSYIGTSLVAAEPRAELQQPSYLTKYDFATRDDLLYARWIEKLIPGDRPSEWPLLGGVVDQVGDWVTDYLEANRIAHAITAGMPIEGQEPLRSIARLVADCAKILDVPKPSVFVRNSPITTAYITEVNGSGVLVLTSGLLRLYDARPDELRFVIGHELGHLKCDHVRIKTASYGILSAIHSINVAIVPDRFQLALPTLALGRLFTWTRESEISADRAGLLCCQNPGVAFQALLRLLHGLDAGNTWINPEDQNFDAEIVVKEFKRWQNEPFVNFVLHLKKSTLQSPFMTERVAALKLWSNSDAYRGILSRREPVEDGQLVVVRKIVLANLAAKQESVNPYLVVFQGHNRLFNTVSTSDVTGAATWDQINGVQRGPNGQPLFFEIWNDVFGFDKLIGGFVIYPKLGTTLYTTSIIWDWNERSDVARNGVAEVTVEFRKRSQ